MTTKFTNDDIRPERFNDAKLRAHAEDLKFYISASDEFVDVPCPACGKKKSVPAFQKYECRFLECRHCSTRYMSPRPTADFLACFYAQSKLYAFWNKYIFPASEAVRREKIFKPRVRRVLEICERLGKCGGTLLEVGAGYGIFSDEMQKRSVFDRVVAVEPSESLAQQCRSYGVETFQQSIESIEMTELQADVLASFEVIEHLFDPFDFVCSCSTRLSEGGILVLSCPNWKGFDIRTLGVDSDNVDNEHINLFTPQSLALLVERAGLEVLEVETPGELDAELVRRAVLEGKLEISKTDWLHEVLVDRWDECGGAFQEFLRSSKLSSHLWLVAQKKNR